MEPLLIDGLLGAVGSPVDAATLMYVVYEVRIGRLASVRDRLDSLRAGLLRLARKDPEVDENRIRRETEGRS